LGGVENGALEIYSITGSLITSVTLETGLHYEKGYITTNGCRNLFL